MGVNGLKAFSIALLILTFFAFVLYQTQKGSEFLVLKIVSPTQIVVDLNGNGIQDNNETVSLDNIESFSTKPSAAQENLALRLKITPENSIGLGFLAQNFAQETLLNKKVKLKNNIIYIDNKDYEKLLVNKGLALFKGEPPSNNISKNIDKAQKLHLVILNNKNHKYHKLACKYGIIAHNAQIMPAAQLPKDAKQCKFCFQEINEHKYNIKSQRYKKYYEEDENYHLISYIKSPPLTYQTDLLKIFLTDMTANLKPSHNCTTNVCRALVQEINSAQSSIDFAIYGYTKVPEIEKALVNAQNRGVKIRFVYDTDSSGNNIYPGTKYLTQILTDNNSDYQPPIMHDKFFIFDNKTVLTGSANISDTDMSGFNSNAVILINSPEIANIYSQEFEQMHNGCFHKQKHKIRNKEFGEFSVYFSPKDSAITNELIPLIEGAKKYIYSPAFLITHKQMTQALIDAKNRGVDVKIILDATNTHEGASKLKILRQAGIQVKTENYAGKLHSKSLIIDDNYTVIGSMNFSRSGEGKNDENMVIIKDKDITIFYRKFFQYLWARIPDKWLYKNARSESPDSIGSCSDGVDNDFDGKIDRADDSCKAYKEIKK